MGEERNEQRQEGEKNDEGREKASAGLERDDRIDQDDEDGDDDGRGRLVHLDEVKKQDRREDQQVVDSHLDVG